MSGNKYSLEILELLLYTWNRVQRTPMYAAPLAVLVFHVLRSTLGQLIIDAFVQWQRNDYKLILLINTFYLMWISSFLTFVTEAVFCPRYVFDTFIKNQVA